MTCLRKVLALAMTLGQVLAVVFFAQVVAGGSTEAKAASLTVPSAESVLTLSSVRSRYGYCVGGSWIQAGGPPPWASAVASGPCCAAAQMAIVDEFDQPALSGRRDLATTPVIAVVEAMLLPPLNPPI